MNKIGFYYEEKNRKENIRIQNTNAETKPIKCVAYVRFEDGSEYPYYNDKFNLCVNDRVYVDGKKYGHLGIVTSITAKFKVSKEKYKTVIAKLDFDFHATFSRVAGFMLSTDKDFISFEQIKSWFVLPKTEDEDDDEYYIGDGYECLIDNISSCPDVTEENFNDGFEILTNDKVKAIQVKNGIGHAIVQNHKATVVDFKIEDGMIKDIYCECISPDFCKHAIAVCIALQFLITQEYIDEKDDFTAIDFNFFASTVCASKLTVTV